MEQLLALLVVAALGFGLWRLFTARKTARADPAIEALAARVEAMGGQVAQIAGQLTQATTSQAATQSAISQSLSDQAQKNAMALGALAQRLKAIDAAQANIVNLSREVVSLQDILSNKQARGAFGQGQMETIIEDTLPAGAYEFQAQLSNGTRPDCLIRLQKATGAIVIDAKFPRESFAALADADGPEALKAAETRVRAEIKKHIDDIASKYLIPGETQDPAIMFLPAESIFCAVFSDFFDVIQYAQRKQVALVSPNMLMLAVNTMRALMRDQKMREQAHLIQEEVRKLLDDVRRLDQRASNLGQHFDQVEKDVREIGISAGKILRRGEQIVAVEMEEKVKPISETPPTLLAGE
ncbi:MAG: DNA recombination protein RmuC [Amphiplicatus sp.]